MRVPFRFALVSAALAGAAAGSLSCTTLECGLGTVERDGECVPGTGTNASTCGEGTALVDGICVPDPIVECDPDTTEVDEDPETGVVTCVGTQFDRSDCESDLPCPEPDDKKMTICGRLYDIGTDEPLAAAETTGEVCAATTATGPCSLALVFFDAVALPTTGLVPIPPEHLEIDDCGRFVAENISPPDMYIGVAVDDVPTTPNDYNPTVTGLPVTSQTRRVQGLPMYATSNATLAGWSASASTAAGTSISFVATGVLAIIFQNSGVPEDGVTVYRSGQAIDEDDVFYFTDSTRQRTTIGGTSTGTNGTALVINTGTSPLNHSGRLACSVNPTYYWDEALGAALPGFVFAQIRNAREGNECHGD